HAQAADLLAERGASSERVARHLLRLPGAGVPARVATLRAAAGEASARGAAEAAARYLRRAPEEPPPAELRGPALHELGLAEPTARQQDRFDAHLREAIAATDDRHERARIALDLGRGLASAGQFRASFDALDDALEALGEPDSELGIALETELIAMG